MVGIKRQFDDDFQPPKNCVQEKILDEVSYNAHKKLYQEERDKLEKEFREDLIQKYKMTHHPKVDKLFNKAWDMGCAGGLEEVEYYFQDLIEFLEPTETPFMSSVIHESDDLIIGKYYYA